MKKYKATVEFRDVDTNTIYGTAVYHISEPNAPAARIAALTASEGSVYFDDRVDFRRGVVLEREA